MKKLYSFFLRAIALINWDFFRKLITGRKYNITESDKTLAWNILALRNVFILTYSKSHLSSHASKLAHLALTGDFATYSHALINIESNGVNFELIEAISKGVKLSTFDEVFNCDGFCILVPKRYTADEIDSCVFDYRSEIGKSYDDFFKLDDASARSCIELVYAKLKSLPDWEERMPVLKYMIEEEKNFTPQMLRDCPDFEVLLEVKR